MMERCDRQIAIVIMITVFVLSLPWNAIGQNQAGSSMEQNNITTTDPGMISSNSTTPLSTTTGSTTNATSTTTSGTATTPDTNTTPQTSTSITTNGTTTPLDITSSSSEPIPIYQFGLIVLGSEILLIAICCTLIMFCIISFYRRKKVSRLEDVQEKGSGDIHLVSVKTAGDEVNGGKEKHESEEMVENKEDKLNEQKGDINVLTSTEAVVEPVGGNTDVTDSAETAVKSDKATDKSEEKEGEAKNSSTGDEEDKKQQSTGQQSSSEKVEGSGVAAYDEEVTMLLKSLEITAPPTALPTPISLPEKVTDELSILSSGDIDKALGIAVTKDLT